MLFPTVTFAAFFLVVLTISWLLMPRPARWKPFMLGASYVFYGAWDYRFVALLAGSTLVNQLFAEAIARQRVDRTRRLLLAGAVTANLAVLGWFKYYGFLASSFVNGLRTIGVHASLPLVQAVLPVGISFFTFQALSYVIDVYRRDMEPVRLFDFAVYLAFFPHVVAGPIVRASELVPQLRRPRDPRHVDASRAFWLILTGLVKKVVIASFLATHVVDAVFASPGRHSSIEALVAIYAYAVQIYADFSGYTDIAIGCALLLGFKFPQNFDAPYTALSLQEFWRRWHMTLSRWLRDYLYIPLGGNRGPRWETYRNLMLTMVLGGLWHGAAWTFVAWGAIHGAGLAVERTLAERRARHGITDPEQIPGAHVARRLVTFHLVCLAWVFFRADSFSAATSLLGRLFTAWGQPSPLVNGAVLAVIALSVAAQYVSKDRIVAVQIAFSRLAPALQGTTLAMGLLVIDVLKPAGVAPFIYFRF